MPGRKPGILFSMIRKELQKLYWQLLIPALILLMASEGAKSMGFIIHLTFSEKRIVSILILVLAALTAVALPVLLRTFFINRVKDQKSVAPFEWLKYERRTMAMALTTPYFFFLASLLRFNRFYYVAVFLLSLYGCYYYFPSQKRIHFEKRLFRIHEE